MRGARPEKLMTETVKRVKVFILPKTKILHIHRESNVRGQGTIIHGRVGFDLRMCMHVFFSSALGEPSDFLWLHWQKLDKTKNTILHSLLLIM